MDISISQRKEILNSFDVGLVAVRSVSDWYVAGYIGTVWTPPPPLLNYLWLEASTFGPTPTELQYAQRCVVHVQICVSCVVGGRKFFSHVPWRPRNETSPWSQLAKTAASTG